MTVLIPTVTELPPAPLVTDSEVDFASKASAFVNSLQGFRTEANTLGAFVEGEADDANTARIGAEDARDESELARDAALAAPSLVNYQGVWAAGTYNTGESVFHAPSALFYISDTDGNTAEPPAGDWREVGTAEATFYDNSESGLDAENVQDAIDEVAAQEPEIASTAQAEAGTDNETFITPLRMRDGFNASGSAPVFACRAWVNFDGTGTVAIRASGNVSSITDNGTGQYTVNFATAMEDANYCISHALGDQAVTQTGTIMYTRGSRLTTSFFFSTFSFSSGGSLDTQDISVSIFR